MILFEVKQDCCGCTACLNACPKEAIIMKQDNEGFQYPMINNNLCVNCGICKKICPCETISTKEDKLKYNKVYAAKNINIEDRKRSTSGGMFIPLSDYVLDNKGVVYGVAFNPELVATHIRVDNKKDRDRCVGSKYSQSCLENVFSMIKKDLLDEKMVLFTGTPCQVTGLNNYLTKIDKQNLILVDIVCHGVPSPQLFADFLKYVQRKTKKKIKEYYHRAKDNGWKQHTEKIVFDDGTIDMKSNLSQAWRYVFFSRYAIRPSCFTCKNVNGNRTSDLTIADYWGIENSSPEFSDDMGISLFIVNSDKGERVFEKIKHKIDYIEKDMNDAVLKNPNLIRPTSAPINREIFWEEYKDKGIGFILKKYGRYNLGCIVSDFIKRILNKIGLLEILKKVVKR